MKARDSGMPERDLWETFFKPKDVLTTLGINHQIKDAVEFGCGYGTFTLPSARIISGTIYALDIEPEMIRITSEETRKSGLKNVRAVLRDFIANGSGLADASMDYALLFNILHLESPVNLLREACRILRIGGKIGIIHWNYDPATPRGPSMDIRPKPECCIDWAKQVGLVDPKQFDLKPYHYGIVMAKKG